MATDALNMCLCVEFVFVVKVLIAGDVLTLILHEETASSQKTEFFASPDTLDGFRGPRNEVSGTVVVRDIDDDRNAMLSEGDGLLSIHSTQCSIPSIQPGT